MIRNKIQKYFDSHDITISSAHHLTGISRSSLTRLYRDEVINLNMDTIDTICTTYKCNFNDLFEFVPQDEMTTEDHVSYAKRKLHVEYNTKLRRKDGKAAYETEQDD